MHHHTDECTINYQIAYCLQYCDESLVVFYSFAEAIENFEDLVFNATNCIVWLDQLEFTIFDFPKTMRRIAKLVTIIRKIKLLPAESGELVTNGLFSSFSFSIIPKILIIHKIFLERISEFSTQKQFLLVFSKFAQSSKQQTFQNFQEISILINMIKDFSFDALGRTIQDQKYEQPQKLQMSRSTDTFFSRRKKSSKLPTNIDNIIGQNKLMEMVYYAKRPASSVESINVPRSIHTINSSDSAYKLAFHQVRKLFPDIEFTQANIWICRDSVSKDIVVYFSQSRIIPQTKCCDSHIKIVLAETGHVDCNKCSSRLIQFVFIAQEKLRSPSHLFSKIRRKQQSINQAISRRIASGKYRCGYLRDLVANQQNPVTKRYDCMVLKKCDSKASDYFRPHQKNCSTIQKEFQEIREVLTSIYGTM